LSSVVDDGSSQITDLSHVALERILKGKGKKKDDMKKLKERNKKEIELFEKENATATQNPNQRMCGCEAFCSIF
jgi:hypothetical protein